MSNETDMTIEYYETNVENFVSETICANMSELHTTFLQYVPDGGSILDFGCGSGRDTKAFLNAGYRVTPLDGSPAICAKATELLDYPVICCSFHDYKAVTQYDGIWACASLLHLPVEEMKPVLLELVNSLNSEGVLYLSFKYGTYSGERNGRWFTDMTEEQLDELLDQFQPLTLIDQWITEDVREDRNEKWINSIYKKN